MDNKKIEEFIRKQKVAFICSVDEEGFFRNNDRTKRFSILKKDYESK